MALQISQDNFYEILSIIGYPAITLEDTNLLTETSVKQFVILPALREYFRFFPLEETQVIDLTGNQDGSIDFPSEDVYGVRDCRFSLYQDTLSSNYSGATSYFFKNRTISKGGGGRLGSRYDYGAKSIQASTAFGNDTEMNTYRVFRWNPDMENRVLTYYTSIKGKLQVIWAKSSQDFSKIPYTQLGKIIKLCQAELLLYWVRYLDKINPDIPSQFDADTMRDEGEEMKKEVMEAWRNHTKSVMMRN